MAQKLWLGLLVALLLLAGSQDAKAAIPPASPLAQAGINQIHNLDIAFENWIEAVCPIYVNVVHIYRGIDPFLGEYYAELYIGVIGRVADNYLDAVDATANVYLSLVTSPSDKARIYDARELATMHIYSWKQACIHTLVLASGGAPAPT